MLWVAVGCGEGAYSPPKRLHHICPRKDDIQGDNGALYFLTVSKATTFQLSEHSRTAQAPAHTPGDEAPLVKLAKLVHQAQHAVAVTNLRMLCCGDVRPPAVCHQVLVVGRHTAVAPCSPALAEVTCIGQQLLQHWVPKHLAQHLCVVLLHLRPRVCIIVCSRQCVCCYNQGSGLSKHAPWLTCRCSCRADS